MSRTVLSLALALALAGCTTASTTMLSQNTALIEAKDLNTGSRSEVRKKALLTAAQTAQAQGYEYFGVVSLEERSSQGWITTSGRMGLGGGGLAPAIPTRDLYADMTVRFLHASELPADRDGIYQTSALLAEPK
jgi:hypothetical protein